MFIGRTDAKAETPVLWPPHVKSWLIGKDSDAGRDWGQEEKGTTEDEMAAWHHWLDGHEFEWTPGVRDGQGGLACCNSLGRKELDTTEQLNWTEVGHSFSSKEQASFNFMAAVTISSDFRVQENKICHCFHCFPIYFLWSMGPDAMTFAWSWVLSQLFHFPLSLSSRGSLVPLCFLL